MENFAALLQRRIWLGPLFAIFLLVIGFGLGLVVGWGTVEFTPSADDIAAAADSFAFNNNRDLARQRLSGLSRAEQERLLNKLIQDAIAGGKTADAQRLAQMGQALGLSISVASIPPSGTPVPTRTTPSTPGSTASTASPFAGIGALVAVVLIAILFFAIAGFIFFRRILPQLKAGPPPIKASPPPRPAVPAPTPVPGPAPAARLKSAPLRAPAVPRPAKSPAAAPPPPAPAPGELGRFVATYTLGNDNYDTSFSLESPRQEFLGECGMGISETIGEGKPDKVTAFDLWLFDKADVRTVTQILMSEFGYEEQSLRAKLTAKGELVLVEKGKVVELETQSLRLKAQVVELVYATNPSFPPNSHFEKLVVEILPSLKEPVPA